MSLVLYTVQKEKERIEYMITAYKRELDSLPKGSVVVKTVGRNNYFYLKYRDGKKVFTDYVGKAGEKVQTVRSQLERRRHIEAMIAHLQSERLLVNKVLEANL